jgi:hypothetical protein
MLGSDARSERWSADPHQSTSRFHVCGAPSTGGISHPIAALAWRFDVRTGSIGTLRHDEWAHYSRSMTIWRGAVSGEEA